MNFKPTQFEFTRLGDTQDTGQMTSTLYGGGANAPMAGTPAAPAPATTTTTTDPTTASYQSLCSGMTYEQFMKHHTSKPGEAYTHTRIGDKALNVHGGVYTIPPAILPVFWKKYYSHVFENGKQEFLTEKQNPEKGIVVVDFDFRYETSITKRQHSK